MCVPGSLCSTPSFGLLSLRTGCWKFSTCLCRFPSVFSTLFHIWMAELSWPPSRGSLNLLSGGSPGRQEVGSKRRVKWGVYSISFSSGRLQLWWEFSCAGLLFPGAGNYFFPCPLGVSVIHSAPVMGPCEEPPEHSLSTLSSSCVLLGALLTHSVIPSSVQFFFTRFYRGPWGGICFQWHSSPACVIALGVLFS